jgi:NDP-sugar pyrophosphorylase family protein
MKAGILAAGDGSRLARAGIATPKPLVKVGGITLIERTMRALVEAGVEEISFIVNDRMACVADAVRGFCLPVPVHPVIRTTQSSMHSLYELASHLRNEDGQNDRFVLCTVDSVMRTESVCDFIHQHATRTELDVLLAYTDFVDDEKPLRIGVDAQHRVVGLGESAADSPFVTLGLYGMSASVFPLLERAVTSGVQRLRNFLARVVDAGLVVHGYRIGKGVDVDRPSDVEVAEAFLLEQEGRA